MTLSAPSDEIITVHYITTDDSATAGQDYESAEGTLTFSPGDTTQTIPVTITNDDTDEPDEFVQLTVTSLFGAPQTATLTINDDDEPPTVGFSQAGYTVGESGGSAPITVALSAPSSKVVTVPNVKVT